jgi:hypothetical protein
MVGGVSTRSVERGIKRMREDPEAHEKAKANELRKAKPVKASTRMHTTGKYAGKEFTMPGPKPKEPDPIAALGALISFTESSAQRWAEDHPDKVGKLRDLLCDLELSLKALSLVAYGKQLYANGETTDAVWEEVTEPSTESEADIEEAALEEATEIATEAPTVGVEAAIEALLGGTRAHSSMRSALRSIGVF